MDYKKFFEEYENHFTNINLSLEDLYQAFKERMMAEIIEADKDAKLAAALIGIGAKFIPKLPKDE